MKLGKLGVITSFKSFLGRFKELARVPASIFAFEPYLWSDLALCYGLRDLIGKLWRLESEYGSLGSFGTIYTYFECLELVNTFGLLAERFEMTVLVCLFMLNSVP